MKKYFVTKGDSYFCTDDNWKTSLKVKEINTNEYTREKNATTKKKVEFNHEFGYSNSKNIIKEFNKIEKKLITFGSATPSDFSDGYGKAFEVFAISVLHNLDYDTVISNYIVHGSFDGKIDSIYYNDVEKSAYIYQIKLGEFSDTAAAEFTFHNFSEFVRNRDVSIKDTSDLKSFMSKYKDYKHLKSCEHKFRFITSSRLQILSRQYEVITPNQIFDKYIQSLLVPLPKTSAILTIPLPLPQIAKVSDVEFFSYVRATILIDSINSMLEEYTTFKFSDLFIDNVRGKLMDSISIQETIRTSASKFSKFNNGISVTGNIKVNAGFAVITGPNIVNGQQTLYSLKNTKHSLNDVFVPVFFKGTSDIDEKRDIAFYNNTQRPIKQIDLLSINVNIRNLQKALFTPILSGATEKYYLDIHSQGMTSFRTNARKLFDKHELIKLSSFIKLYFTILTPSSLGLWKNTFSKQLSTVNISTTIFDKEESMRICKTISSYQLFLAQNDDANISSILRTGDLPVMYLMYMGKSINECLNILNLIIEKEAKAPKDVFRSRAIYSKLKPYIKK